MKIGWWSKSGLASGAKAGRVELDRRDMNIMVFDAPAYGVTVAIAREGHRSEDLRAWLDNLTEMTPE